jgi:predicted nuclease of predicted toxin-antitoxin system
MLRFKFDENMPAEAAELFRNAGHDAATVLDQSLGGQPDPNIAKVCQDEDRVLVTLDLDFADIRAYPPASCPGIIVLRLTLLDKVHLLAATSRLLTLLSTRRGGEQSVDR